MIIGISGKLGSGKDLVTSYIQALVYEDSETRLFKTAFAYHLKDIVARVTGCLVTDLDSRGFKTLKLTEKLRTEEMQTYRDMLQTVGSALSEVHPDFFVHALFANLVFSKDVIISDVRFPNEVQAIKERGGVIIRIEREISTEKHNAQHISETALDDYDDFDYTINNRIDSYQGMSPSESRDALKYKVENALKHLNLIK